MQSQITKFPIIKPFAKTVNRDVGRFGLQQAMMNTVKRSGTKLIVEGKTKEVLEVLRNKSVVLIANHPHEVDIVALFAALPSRKDTFLIISSRFMNLAPNADKYLIPVYVEHNNRESKMREQLRAKFLKTFHPVKTYTPEEEHQKNKENIALASEKVKKGGMVTIFPNPTKYENRKWYSGVGHLLKGAKNKKPIYVVQAYIEGTSNMDYLRLIPHAAKLLTPIRVTFSAPIKVNKELEKHPKEIAADLEKNYKAWVKDLIKNRAS